MPSLKHLEVSTKITANEFQREICAVARRSVSFKNCIESHFISTYFTEALNVIDIDIDAAFL